MRVLLINNYYNKSNEDFFLAIKDLLHKRDIILEFCFLIDSKKAGRNWNDNISLDYLNGYGIRIWKFTLFPFWKFKNYDRYIVFEDVPVGINYLIAYYFFKWKLETIEESVVCPTFSFERFYKNIISYFLLKVSNNIYVTSKLSQKYVQLFSNRDINYIGLPSFIEDPHQEFDLLDGKVKILHVGSNYKRKGVKLIYNYLIEILNNFQFTTVGDNVNSYGIFHENYENLSRAAVYDQMRLNHILVLNSKDEPWGHVVPEAMLNGCIPLVSDRCGSKDILEDFCPDLVFKYNDSGDFERAVNYALDLLKDITKLKSFFHKAKSSVSNYSALKCAQKLCDVLK
jgi:glycosyltransferase involved in cell wall biosynthesis